MSWGVAGELPTLGSRRWIVAAGGRFKHLSHLSEGCFQYLLLSVWLTKVYTQMHFLASMQCNTLNETRRDNTC